MAEITANSMAFCHSTNALQMHCGQSKNVWLTCTSLDALIFDHFNLAESQHAETGGHLASSGRTIAVNIE